MVKKIEMVFALSLILLAACANTNIENAPPSDISEGVSSVTIESAPQTFEPDIETKPDNINTFETLIETSEPEIIRYPSTPRLLYDGEIYAFIVGSSVTEVDGKFYELMEDEIIAQFIDAERMKAECEYIGQSIPISDDFMPEHEFELTSYYDVPCELYKVDEDQILVYCPEEYEITDDRFKQTMFYPGTYQVCLIVVKGADEKTQANLIAKYYRYKERFPET